MSLAYVPMQGVGELAFSLKPPKAVRKAVSAVAAKLKPPAAVRKVFSVVAPIAAIAAPIVGGALIATKVGKAVTASKTAARAAKTAKTVGALKKATDRRTLGIRQVRDRVNAAVSATQAPVSIAQQAQQATDQGLVNPTTSATPTQVVTTTAPPSPDPAPAPTTVAQQAAQAAAQGYTTSSAAPSAAVTTSSEPVLTASTGEGTDMTPFVIGGALLLGALAFMAGRKGGRS